MGPSRYIGILRVAIEVLLSPKMPSSDLIFDANYDGDGAEDRGARAHGRSQKLEVYEV